MRVSSLFLFIFGIGLMAFIFPTLEATGPCGCECLADCHCGCAYTGKCACEQHSLCNDTCQKDLTPPEDLEDSWGVWLVEAPPIFRPFVADPRQVTFSAGWRFNDRIFANNTCPVSFGDLCTLYRLYNPFGVEGVMEIGVEGALWAIFEQTEDSAPLVNADYYVGFPISFSRGCWSFRLRPFHISSHIGDEFLITHPNFDRRNPSSEYLDFAVAYQPNQDLRLYGLIGYILRSDNSFPFKKLYFEYGLEKYFSRWGFYSEWQQLMGRPYVAVDIHQKKDTDYRVNSTIAVGYEFRKTCGLERCLRLFAEFHDGYSVEGQFCHLRTTYTTLRISYGF